MDRKLLIEKLNAAYAIIDEGLDAISREEGEDIICTGLQEILEALAIIKNEEETEGGRKNG